MEQYWVSIKKAQLLIYKHETRKKSVHDYATRDDVMLFPLKQAEGVALFHFHCLITSVPLKSGRVKN